MTAKQPKTVSHKASLKDLTPRSGKTKNVTGGADSRTDGFKNCCVGIRYANLTLTNPQVLGQVPPSL